MVLTRSEVIDVRALVTVAEVTTSIRGHAAEVAVDHEAIGLDQPSVVNADGLHTIPKASLSGPVGALDDRAIDLVSDAVGYALGC